MRLPQDSPPAQPAPALCLPPAPSFVCLGAGRLGWLALCVALVAACGAQGLLEPLTPAVALLEFDSRVLDVRYTDVDGFPVQNARCTFSTLGSTNGAYLESRVSVTDRNGICRATLITQHAASFEVVVKADGASSASIAAGIGTFISWRQG
jgi:hypothetical protein